MQPNLRAPLVVTCGLVGAIALGLAGSGSLLRPKGRQAPRVSIRPPRISANGFDAATLTIEDSGAATPRITPANAHAVFVEQVSRNAGSWTARLRAGVLPGPARIRVEIGQAPAAYAEMEIAPGEGDSFGDGTPDFLRLTDEHDVAAFRRWFTYLAEAQYFLRPESRPAEIDDCAALIRYAYREALREHDGAWAAAANLPIIPAFDSIAKYQYPFTPLVAALFRVRPGPFRLPDAGGAFAQFADAKTLCRLNTHPVGRSLDRLLPGDLLFYRRDRAEVTYHSMIYLGESQLRPSGERYVVYHTGPDGENSGEIRRLSIGDLLTYPQPEWRPLAANPNFLGVFRWNILRKEQDADVLARD